MGQEGIQDDEEPLHYVKVKPFEVDRFEIKIVDWFFIANWAVKNGYTFSDSSSSPWEDLTGIFMTTKIISL